MKLKLNQALSLSLSLACSRSSLFFSLSIFLDLDQELAQESEDFDPIKSIKLEQLLLSQCLKKTISRKAEYFLKTNLYYDTWDWSYSSIE